MLHFEHPRHEQSPAARTGEYSSLHSTTFRYEKKKCNTFADITAVPLICEGVCHTLANPSYPYTPRSRCFDTAVRYCAIEPGIKLNFSLIDNIDTLAAHTSSVCRLVASWVKAYSEGINSVALIDLQAAAKGPRPGMDLRRIKRRMVSNFVCLFLSPTCPLQSRLLWYILQYVLRSKTAVSHLRQ